MTKINEPYYNVSTAMNVIIDFVIAFESAGGDSGGILQRIKLGEMSVIELFDTMTRNGITFKYNKPSKHE